MIYKERAIRDQPMDMVYLNAWVSVYQFLGGLMLAPLIFDAEVSNGDLLPSSHCRADQEVPHAHVTAV